MANGSTPCSFGDWTRGYQKKKGQGLRNERCLPMPREGAIIFRDIVGKLDVLRIESGKCGRRDRYRVDRLLKKYGIDAKLFAWSDEVTADCPRKIAKNLRVICVGLDAPPYRKWCEIENDV